MLKNGSWPTTSELEVNKESVDWANDRLTRENHGEWWLIVMVFKGIKSNLYCLSVPGNAGSANGTKNPPNYCEFLEHGGLETKYYA